MQVLTRSEWTARAEAHTERARQRTASHRARKARGEKHPIEDFLFDYYGFRPSLLERWQPGPGLGLEDADEIASRRFYRTIDDVTSLDVDAFVAARGRALDWALDILRATDAHEPSFSCFGLHEWAMVYHLGPDAVRHQAIPLRVTPDEVSAVVESHEIRCSHYDAFRFFTPDARPLNHLQPGPEVQASFEQPGCLHGGAMDLYRWSYKLDPAIPSELMLDCFDLARRARDLDMASAPYDTEPLGLANILVETPEGKAEHVRRQREIADAAAPLRARLIGVLEELSASRSS